MVDLKTIAALAAGLASAVNAHCGIPDLLSGCVVARSESESRHGTRTFFTMPVKQDLGIFSTIIKRVDLSVYYEKIDDDRGDDFQGGYWIVASLAYEHPNGGTNGSDIATVWLNGDFSFKQMRLADGRVIKAEALAA